MIRLHLILLVMVAGLTAGRPKYADVAASMEHVARQASALTNELLSLVERDAAYLTDDGVYFEVQKVPDYGLLPQQVIDEMICPFR